MAKNKKVILCGGRPVDLKGVTGEWPAETLLLLQQAITMNISVACKSSNATERDMAASAARTLCHLAREFFA